MHNREFVFEKSLLEISRVKSWPALLPDFPHWKSLYCQGILTQEEWMAPTWFLFGFFYNGQTLIETDPSLISETKERAVKSGARQVFVPSVRDHNEANNFLERSGFRRLKGDVESALVFKTEVSEHVLYYAGYHNFNEIRSLSKKARYSYPLVFEEKPTDSFLKIIADLHEEHCKRYGHLFNIYNFEILKSFTESGHSFMFGVRWDKERPVQGMILYHNPLNNELCFLSMATQRQKIPIGHNLYLASFWEVYHEAYRRNVVLLSLGRGNQALTA